MSALTSIFKREIRIAYDKLMNDECELDEEQMAEIMKVISHKPLSKASVCDDVLHVSQSTFNTWLGLGWMPKGRHRKGFKELVWYEDEVLDAVKLIKM